MNINHYSIIMMSLSFVVLVVSKKDAGELTSFGRSRSPLQGIVCLYVCSVYIVCVVCACGACMRVYCVLY